MELTYGIGLAVLEMTFIFVGLLILHGLRKVIGSAGFYIALGLLFVFTQLVGAAGLRITTGITGLDFNLSSSILLLPSLAALVVVYVSEGTLATQRLIIGLMASLGLYVYLASLTASQAEWGGYIVKGKGTEVLAYLMKGSMHNMVAYVLAFTLDLFLIPIIYQRLRNLNSKLFICVLGSLMIVQMLDSVVYSTICYWNTPEWWVQITQSYLSRSVFMIWLSIIAWIYLSRIESETPGESRRSLDILIAFFGTYGRAKQLEQNLKESESRYRNMVRKASDMIVMMDSSGIIVEANQAAERLFGMSSQDLIGKPFASSAGIKEEKWAELLTFTYGPTETLDESSVIQVTCMIPQTSTQVEMTFSMILLAGLPMLIAFGRDVTEKLRFEQEKEELRAQMAHKQRLESIGQLAGGIAHDFNNYLHAIQGHLDIIKYMCEQPDESTVRHLNKIDAITTQAATLTSQLLGFARKGKYQETELELGALVRDTRELFMPDSSENHLTVNIVDDIQSPLYLRGDIIQLQQAILNMMFNARDAMNELPEKMRILTLQITTIDRLGQKLDPPAELKLKQNCNYCVIRIKDHGYGITPEVRNRIFEPFFTTKPVGKGTGMGLSMAYGTALGHGGWIHCESELGVGSTFSIVLPVESTE